MPVEGQQRQHAATAGRALNRYLENIARLDIYLNIYTEETVLIHSTGWINRGDEWSRMLHMAGSLVLVCQKDFS
jgi:hypothetical protein